MSCIDAVNAVNAGMQGMSLSSVISRGIAITLHTLRSEKILPDRDGFEYNDMIAPYTNLTRVEKIKTGHEIVMQRQRDEATDAPQPHLHRAEPKLSDAEKRQRTRMFNRIRELEMRKEADPLNWKPEHEREYSKLRKEAQAW